MSYLVKALDRAGDFGVRTLSMARASAAKSAGGYTSFAEAIGAEGASADRWESMSTPAAQYAYNKNWVYACVNLVSQRVASQELHIASVPSAIDGPTTTKSYGDDLEPLLSHPLLDLLHSPNATMSLGSLLYVTTASLELCGRSLWWLVEKAGRMTILPVPQSWIVKTDIDHTYWEIQPPTQAKVTLAADETVLFYRPDPADPGGCKSPLSAISEPVQTDQRIAQCHHAVFTQGHFPQYAVVLGKNPAAPGTGAGVRPTLTAEQRQQIITALRRAFQGSHHYGEPVILDGVIEKLEKLTLTPDELQFRDSAKLTKSKICQAYGVSPILLGEIEGANRASAAVADENFTANKINPLLMMLAEGITRFLCPKFAKPGEELRCWFDQARPRDSEMQLRRWQFAATSGAVTINEIRRFLNLPPIDGGDTLLDELPTAAGELAKRLNPYTLKRLTESGNAR